MTKDRVAAFVFEAPSIPFSLRDDDHVADLVGVPIVIVTTLDDAGFEPLGLPLGFSHN